ncbi:DUF523 domain-containing protein [Alloalcanivorax marinus]|uniref:DUF523 domain-containing protein n=1 Tax=Alloalcanivorax marinus TaxID=1177169 RepID=UPI0019314EBB|nr:DUF523 domain-containing protein [Alloalcanivorax marinus]MBL7250863.1 DUF523 domain-containing protein [Alloalcanivorax marinus]
MLPDLLRQMGFETPRRDIDKPVIGVSACLMGEPVRHDGDHRRHALVHDQLAALVRVTPVCPEVSIGLPVPRPPIQVVELNNQRRVRGVADPDQDFTEALSEQAGRLPGPLSGFVLKSRSPSCGLGTTPVHDARGSARGLGDGAFANALAARHPRLPMANDCDLDDPLFARAFVLRVFCHHHWRAGGNAALRMLRHRSATLGEPLLSGTRRFLDRLARATP